MEFTFSGSFKIESDGKNRYKVPVCWLKGFTEPLFIYPYHNGNYMISSLAKVRHFLKGLRESIDPDFIRLYSFVASKIYEISLDGEGRIFLPSFKGAITLTGRGDCVEVITDNEKGEEGNDETYVT
ncbi:MAG: hypothetical protein IJY84_06345 [Clostridia bacterium]|nr:hypothetical protein [Clostridia bacterium]